MVLFSAYFRIHIYTYIRYEMYIHIRYEISLIWLNVRNADNQTYCIVKYINSCSMLCASLDGRGVWGIWTCICMAESPFTIHPKISQHCYCIYPNATKSFCCLKIKIKKILKKKNMFLNFLTLFYLCSFLLVLFQHHTYRVYFNIE